MEPAWYYSPICAQGQQIFVQPWQQPTLPSVGMSIFTYPPSMHAFPAPIPANTFQPVVLGFQQCYPVPVFHQNESGGVDEQNQGQMKGPSKNNSKRRGPRKTPRGCSFCFSNGEKASNALNHNVKNLDGEVTCPVLKAYRCPICKKTGKEAHTISYCPAGSTMPERQVRRTSTGGNYFSRY